MRSGRMVTTMIVLTMFATSSSYAGYADAVRKGNKAFGEKDYATALEKYREAETDRPTSPEIDYNLGGALFEQGKYEEAVDKYTRALNTTDPKLAGAAQFNLGNTYYRMQDYVKAISSYEEALKTNPADIDAKYNLELARKMLKEHSKGENQQQQNQQQQQQQQQGQNEDKDDQQKQDQQQPQSQPDSAKNQQPPQQQQGQSKDQKKMTKEDAERILNALRDNEKDTQKKLNRQVQTGEYNGKDW